MAVLKYKNGNSWQKLEVDSKGITLDCFPVYSIYPMFALSSFSGSFSPFFEYPSPASFLGGTWTKIYMSGDAKLPYSGLVIGSYSLSATGSTYYRIKFTMNTNGSGWSTEKVDASAICAQGPDYEFSSDHMFLTGYIRTA